MKVPYGGLNILMRNLNQKIVFVYALHSSQQFVSHVGMFSCDEPVLNCENKVSCVLLLNIIRYL